MPDEPQPRSIRRLEGVQLAAFVFAIGCGTYAAISRGIWMDELWSLRLGDPTLSVDELWRGLLQEANPISGNILYRLVAGTGATDIGTLRLLLNLPAALLLLVATFAFSRTSPTRSPFYVIFVLLVLTLPGFIDGLSDYRSYFWQICWSAMLLQFAYAILVERARPALPRSRTLAGLGLLSIVVATMLHFIAGLVVSSFVSLLLLRLAVGRMWRVFLPVATAAAAVWLLMIVQAIRQYGHISDTFDFNWISTTPMQGIATIATALIVAAGVNLVASGWAVAAYRDLDEASAGRVRGFAGLLLVGLVGSALLLLAINGVKPFIVARYLLVWQVAVCALIAALGAARVAASGRRLAGVLAVSALVVGLTATVRAREANWHATRDFIAAAVSRCPASRVYATTSWTLGPGAESRYAAWEGRTMIAGYRSLARQAGFDVTILDASGGRLGVDATCPTLLWIEHLAGRPVPDARFVTGRARTRFDRSVRTSMFRSPNGLVLVALPTGGTR